MLRWRRMRVEQLPLRLALGSRVRACAHRRRPAAAAKITGLLNPASEAASPFPWIAISFVFPSSNRSIDRATKLKSIKLASELLAWIDRSIDNLVPEAGRYCELRRRRRWSWCW
ncbi:hypothetical protein GUJ93_ZPchr0012g19732 [Zizania palustris]|uniref:Uncharacterized protein n=1 Tax=Zizania palustris TaxID=103762 RepID=A0A8J5WQ50_ZIZPA|nr:hypothetical protein GUJ93_ZPchr0012g19732 [Zizania palustris]